MKNSTPTHVAMTIAGSDNSGGAGIEADLKSFTTLGVYGTCAITCVVAEHPACVKAIQAVRTPIVQQQIELNLEAFRVSAIKTGMLYSKSIITAVAEILKTKRIPLVVDPVMIATSGAALLQPSAVRAMENLLLPRAILMTPNLDEASLLLQRKIVKLKQMPEAARDLEEAYGCAVLLKGGHLKGTTAIDLLCLKGVIHEFSAPFRKGLNTHGTGCTLSAAITAGLANGLPLINAVAQGKSFVTNAIEHALPLGRWKMLNHLPSAQ